MGSGRYLAERAKYARGEEFRSPPTDSKLPTVKWTGFLFYTVHEWKTCSIRIWQQLLCSDGNKMKWPLTLERMGWDPKRKMTRVYAHTHSQLFVPISFIWMRAAPPPPRTLLFPKSSSSVTGVSLELSLSACWKKQFGLLLEALASPVIKKRSFTASQKRCWENNGRHLDASTKIGLMLAIHSHDENTHLTGADVFFSVKYISKKSSEHSWMKPRVARNFALIDYKLFFSPRRRKKLHGRKWISRVNTKLTFHSTAESLKCHNRLISSQSGKSIWHSINAGIQSESAPANADQHQSQLLDANHAAQHYTHQDYSSGVHECVSLLWALGGWVSII